MDNDHMYALLHKEYAPLIKKIASAPSNAVYGYERDDIEQELNMTLWKCSARYDATRGATFKSYFITCAKNRIMELRKANRHRPHPSDIDVDQIQSEGLTPLDEYTITDVLRALDGVPNGELVKLSYIYGLSQAVIAEKMGVNQTYAGRLINKAIDEVRSKLS